MNASFKKWMSRFLILSIANPALFVPSAMARDTEVYSGFLAEAATIKPNVLFLLDTSDSMNLPDAWKEYPGAYDSHVEYLWNDLGVIGDADANTAGENTALDDNTKISTAATPTIFFTKMGFWYGADLPTRQLLWQAARASAKATEAGDPGPRTTYRNYNDLSWIYWLPTAADEADARLRSPSWNRFRGYIQELGDGNGGFQLRGGPSYTDTNDYRVYNQCGASLNDLTPSTVFVPSDVARNSGKYIGQQWARWDSYLNLTNVGNAGYPGSSTLAAALGGANQYPGGYIDTSSPSAGNPANNLVFRDSYPLVTPANPPNVGAEGLPIRYDSGSAGAGWDQMKADMGGFILRAAIAAYSSRADLEQVMSWYSLPLTTDVDASAATDLNDAKFIAYKGNRDGAPLFGSMTGVPAYRDTTPAACDSATGPADAVNRTCLDKPGAVAIPDITITKSRTCSLTGGTSETDANNVTVKRGSACTSPGPVCSGDTNGASSPNCTDVADPAACPAATTANTSFMTEKYSGCARGGLTDLTAATTCALTGNLTRNVGGCSVAGASNITIAACAISGGTDVPVAACGWSGQTTRVIGTCAWSGRSATYNESPAGWRATGGSCQESGVATYCTATVNNTLYPTQAAAIAATASCTNAVAPNTYKYGGTCTENGSASSCQITGGANVAGLGLTNASCSNSLAQGTYTYGGTCKENGSTLSCNAPSGGTSRTIRGNTQLYGQSCSNKANAAPVFNASGTSKTQGGTCAASQNNNTCTSGVGASFTIRGANYTPTTCTASLATGTYNRGGTCSGTNVPCTTVVDYGGTTISDGTNNWFSTKRTCTPPTSATSYYSTCAGTKKIIASVGGGTTTTNNTITACNFTSHLVGAATAYDTCTNKPNVSTNCTARYGSQCQTACSNPANTSTTGGAVSAVHNYYRTYNFKEKTDYLTHDCKADDAVVGNPGGNSYMRNIAGTLAPVATVFNNVVSASIASTAAAYSTIAAQSVAVDADKKVDMYSVNYLNWKFGPKGPTGAPIGRKTRLQIAKDVMADVVGAINGVRIGLMSYNQTERVSLNASGAHLDKAIKDMEAAPLVGSCTSPVTAAAFPVRCSLIASVNALRASAATPLSESLFEAHRYFRGDAPWFGGSASGTNYPALESINSTVAVPEVVTRGRDTSADAIVAGSYKSPITATCQANMVIFVSDGAPENDWSANAAILALPDVAPISINQATPSQQFETGAGLPYGPADSASAAASPDNYVLLDELAYYMANVDVRADMPGDQLVKLSTVQFGVDAPVLAKAAEVGGGNSYSANSATELRNALEAAILAVSQWQPVGSSPATTFNIAAGKSDDVYLTAFSPSSNISWPGTVKKFKYGFGLADCGDAACGNPNVCLTGNPNVSYGACAKNVEYLDFDAALGITLRKIRSEAVSYWIPVAPPDGGSGSKGGTGQMLVSSGSPDTRHLYTFIPGISSEVLLSDPTNAVNDGNALITKTLLGDAGMTDALRTELIAYAQGSDGISTAAWRAWPHYDSVHAAPTVDEKTGTTVYYVTSDGVVHAANTATGNERWSFMVEEGLPRIADLKANVIGVHLEVADGNPVQVTTADGKQLLVFGMRRGGRAYYALDVTNPDSPKFAWKITPSQICQGTVCNASVRYAELGQAWSTPAVGVVRGHTDGGAPAKLKPVLIFGGGYDENQDAVAPVADTMGRAIFVADAADGSWIRTFDVTDNASLVYSMPADVLALDVTGDSYRTLDRVYAGDMGGNLWRIDLDDQTVANDPANWSIVLLAKLATPTRPNKLFNRPTMAKASFDGQVFDAIFAVGGDTQRPTAKGATDAGAFYMVKDFATAGSAMQKIGLDLPDAARVGDFVDMTMEFDDLDLSHANLTAADLVVANAKRALLKAAIGGYVINLFDGEKGTSYARVVGGIVYFGTYYPRQDVAGGQCVLGGYGNQYQMNALTGSPLRDESLSHTLLYAPSNHRGVGHCSGFCGAVSVVGSGNKLFVGGGGADTPAASAKGNAGASVFWYSVPE